MDIILPLDKMSKVEKLQIMEQIWEDLIRNKQEIDSPDWHKEILKERELAVKEGRELFVPWAEAKKRLREKHS